MYPNNLRQEGRKKGTKKIEVKQKTKFISKCNSMNNYINVNELNTPKKGSDCQKC